MYGAVVKDSVRGRILAIDQDQPLHSVKHRDRSPKTDEIERMASIGRMACFISHDLRHPLSAIYANLEFLSFKETLPSDWTELLHEVQEAVTVMAELIDSLLRFARGGGQRPFADRDIGSTVERAVNVVRHHPAAREVSIALEILPTAPASIDAMQLESAIYNLVLNACQAATPSNPEPKVSVSVRGIGTITYIIVADNGPGVPSSIRETLFEPFVTCGKPEGLGLGLAMVREIAEELQGSVDLTESRPGRTVFTLRIGPQERVDADPGKA